VGGIASAEGVTVQILGGDVECRANEAVRPMRCNGDLGAEQPDAAAGIGAAKENDLVGRGRRCEQTRDRFARMAGPVRGEEGLIARAQLPEVAMPEALPHLGLPQAVEALNGRLEPPSPVVGRTPAPRPRPGKNGSVGPAGAPRGWSPRNACRCPSADSRADPTAANGCGAPP
jgi:hypothetical protein